MKKIRIKTKMEMTECKSCGGEMPLLRKTLYGYKNCIKCSDIKPYGCAHVTNHKTGNEIQILPHDVAERHNRIAARQGYGVSNGMKFTD
jgi:hypothetical protein